MFNLASIRQGPPSPFPTLSHSNPVDYPDSMAVGIFFFAAMTKLSSMLVVLNHPSSHLFNGVLLSSNLGNLGNGLNVVIEVHLQTFAECQVCLWYHWETKFC